MLLAVDDVHWSDSPSLQFLTYLAPRLEGMAVAIVATARAGDPAPAAPLIAELVTTSGVRLVRPAPLSIDGVGQLVREHLGADADQRAGARQRRSAATPGPRTPDPRRATGPELTAT